MITLDSPIVGRSTGTAEQAIAWLTRVRGQRFQGRDDVDTYVRELWRLADLVGFDAAILFAQAVHETSDPLPFTSFWWEERRNPAGIGITGDPAQDEASGTWATGTDSARAVVVHMCAYTGQYTTFPGEEVPADYVDLDPRWNAVFDAGYAGTVRVLGDLGNGRWAVDPGYAVKIRDRANQIFEDPIRGAMPVPTITAKECPIEIRVLTGSAPNRPAMPMPSPSYVTVHEVGNTSPGADEEMHARFVHNGGGDAAVSFHFIVGPTKAIQLIYLNENAWHASDGYNGAGNRDTIAIETVQIGDFAKTLSHLAFLIAELFRNPRRFAIRPDVSFTDDLPSDDVLNRIKQHNFWAPDKKSCPQFIRERGLWEPLLAAVKAELSGGTKPATYAEPLPFPVKRGDVGISQVANAKVRAITCEVECVKPTGTGRYQTASSKAPRIGPDIKQGQKVVVVASLTLPSASGKRIEHWYVTEKLDRVGASGFKPVLPKP